MFYNCSSLSSLPDISKQNTSKVANLSDLFLKCTSLISLPDISKWKTHSLKEMRSLFLDCNLLLNIPDISKWDNYNENDLYQKADYQLIKKIFNFSADILFCPYSPDKDEIFNNIELINKQFEDKLDRFLE